MNKESLFKAGAIIGALYLTKEIAFTAFSKPIRREILIRDNFTCQGVDKTHGCVWEEIQGLPASWARGHMVTASHWDHTYDKNYQQSHNGRCQCVACHYMYELSIGEPEHAKKLENGLSIWHHDAQEHPERYERVDMSIESINDVLHRLGEVREAKEARVAKARVLLTGHGLSRRIG